MYIQYICVGIYNVHSVSYVNNRAQPDEGPKISRRGERPRVRLSKHNEEDRHDDDPTGRFVCMGCTQA